MKVIVALLKYTISVIGLLERFLRLRTASTPQYLTFTVLATFPRWSTSLRYLPCVATFPALTIVLRGMQIACSICCDQQPIFIETFATSKQDCP